MEKQRSKKIKPEKGKQILRGVPVLSAGAGLHFNLDIDEITSVTDGKIKLKKSNKTFKGNGRHQTSDEELFFIPESFNAILIEKQMFKPDKVRVTASGLKILKDIRDGVENEAG